MPPFILLTLVLASLVFLPSGADAAGLSATGISLPFFSDAGRLTHRLKAKSATQNGARQAMREVEIHYFAADDPSLVVQKIQVADATWDERGQTLAGNGAIVVATVESRLTGEDFDFALATSLLRIHQNFTLTNDEVRLASNRAIIELVVEQKPGEVKVRDVRRCEAIGNLHIVVQPAAQPRYRVKEAFSERAVYDGGTGSILLPEPTRTLQADGGQGNFDTLTINLRDPSAAKQ